MKLEYLILGLLKFNPSTGYDIKKYLDTEGRFGRARAPLSQIYTTLKRMLERDWVIFEEESREGKPNAKVYHNTEEGEKVFMEFLHSPAKLKFRFRESDIHYRIMFAFLVEPNVVIQHLKAELDYRREQIATYRHRDRTLQTQSLPKEQVAYAQEIYEKLHGYGAKSIDEFVLMLEEMIEFFEQQKHE